jgi:ABC-type transporter Mla subunit MlaD
MTEDISKLQHAVGELHDALESTSGLTPEARDLLQRVLVDVRDVLERAQAPGASLGSPQGLQDLPLRAQLAEAAAEFEGEHPTLGGTLRSVIDALAQIGI